MTPSVIQLPPEEDFPLVNGRILIDAGPSERGWHHAEDMLVCPQKWSFRHHPKMKADPLVTFPRAAPLVRGTLLHLGVAHFHRRLQAIQEGDDPDKWHDPMTAISLFAAQEDAKPNQHPKSTSYDSFVIECQKATTAYVNWWTATQGKLRVIAVERQMRAFIPEGGWSLVGKDISWLFTQRLDLITQDAAGYYYVVDAKTRGRKDPRQMRGYSRSGQFQGVRIFGQNAFGKNFGGVYIHYVTFTKGAKGAEVTFSCQREAPPVKPFRVVCFPDTIRYAERQIQDFQLMGLDPWLYPKIGVENGGCESRYGQCPAAELCDFGPAALEPITGVGRADPWGENL